MTTSQTELLIYLYRQSGPVLLDHLDGRSLRALKNRDLVEVRGEWVSLTPEGRRERERLAAEHHEKGRRRRRTPVSAAGARAQSILKAVDDLERAVPIDAEIELTSFRAYADDILAGLRQFARQMAA